MTITIPVTFEIEAGGSADGFSDYCDDAEDAINYVEWWLKEANDNLNLLGKYSIKISGSAVSEHTNS